MTIFQAKARSGWSSIIIEDGILKLKRFHQEENIPIDSITDVSVFKATYDLPFIENSVKITTQSRKFVIKRMKKQEASKLKQKILEMLNNNQSQPTSSISELEKLAELKEKGIVTQEEFDAKKKELLNI